jgi:hypothetical protein
LHINFVEIANFRKLLSVRVDFSEATTLFVGANNSGKSSAILLLRRFLVPQRCHFELHDFTLCHWPLIDAIGQTWIRASQAEETINLDIKPWESLLPTLDLWLDVGAGEMHRVRDLIPTLDWEGGALGVRLRYEPTDLTILYKDFITAVAEAEALREVATAQQAARGAEGKTDTSQKSKFTLWPSTMVDFLSRRLSRHFTIRAYTLDPSQLKSPIKSQAQIQPVPTSSQPIDGDPLKGLIRVHDIPAQRGFGEDSVKDDDDGASSGPPGSRLTAFSRSTMRQSITSNSIGLVAKLSQRTPD